MHSVRRYLTPAWIKSLSGLCINLSAAWLATVFVVPNFTRQPITSVLLTNSISYGILYLLLSVYLENLLIHESA